MSFAVICAVPAVPGNGDAKLTTTVAVADVFYLNYLFAGGPVPPPL